VRGEDISHVTRGEVVGAAKLVKYVDRVLSLAKTIVGIKIMPNFSTR
jgi:hypothetical protein